MAVSCSLTPVGRLRLAGVIVMAPRPAEVPVKVVLPEILPKVA